MAGLPKNKVGAGGGNNRRHSGNGFGVGAGSSKYSALKVDDAEGDEDEKEIMAGLPKNKGGAGGGNSSHDSVNGVGGGAGRGKYSALEIKVDDLEGDEDEMEYPLPTSSKDSDENHNYSSKKTLPFLFALVGISVFFLVFYFYSSSDGGGGGGGGVRSSVKIINDLAQTDEAVAAWKGEGAASDLSYDREKWERIRPRIVILADPHKSGSTSIQSFFSSIAGSTVHLTNKTFDSSQIHTPHPSITDWVWPLGVHEEELDPSVGGGFRAKGPTKYYAGLGALIVGAPGQPYRFFPEATQEDKDKIIEYYRALFRRSWEEGKNIVFGMEIIDILVHDLFDMPIESNHGEEMHVPPNSGKKIDSLLDVLPWDGNSTTRTTASLGGHVPPLRLEDIEVQIDFRTPRISHVISLWHQQGGGRTMRQWLGDPTKTLFQTNSLALALQFVRRGIRTSILDMAGVSEKTYEEAFSQSTANETDAECVVGGIQGVIACEILRMGESGDGPCDERSRIHLPGYRPQDYINVKSKTDEADRNLTPEQIDEMNRVLDEYDCGVWKYLEKYRAKGTLRILYPSESIFENCNPNEVAIRDISWRSTINEVREINSQDNGIPKQEHHPL